MGKIKGIFGLAALALLGCGNDSSADAVLSVPASAGSSEFPNDALSSGEQIVASSSSNLEELSSSSVSFDSSYFGGINPAGSCSSELPLLSSSSDGFSSSSSSSGELLPSSSSSMEPQPSLSSSSSERPSFGSSSAVVPGEDHESGDTEPPPPPQYHSDYIVGADISRFQEYESYGTRIFDTDGTEKDIFTLLRDHGFNAIRLKTFLSPRAQYGYAAPGCGQDSEAFGDKEHVVAYAQKVKKAGFTFLLDIHYSDVWADPDTQIIPERWRKVANSDAMADSVYNYTYDLMDALEQVDALPDMVQIGNEITNGMLRDLPTSSTNCWGDNVQLASNSVNGVMNKQQNPNGIANTVKYLSAGSRAVKSFETSGRKIKTVFHIESPQNSTTVNWWMNSIIKEGKAVPDVMAFSAYTAYDHGTPDTWKKLISSLAGSYPNLEFLIAEYNGGTDKNFYDFDGSRARTHQIMEQVPRGLGAFFWEPASYGEWGSALLDWDGNTLKANPKAFDEYRVLFSDYR